MIQINPDLQAWTCAYSGLSVAVRGPPPQAERLSVRVLLALCEAYPFAKSGGLAGVGATLLAGEEASQPNAQLTPAAHYLDVMSPAPSPRNLPARAGTPPKTGRSRSYDRGPP